MRLRARLVGLLATLVLAGIVIGLPAVLLAVGANPLPHGVPSPQQLWAALTSPDDGTLALGAVKLLAWAAWAFLTGSIGLEAAARVRGVKAPDLPGLVMPQLAARQLVAAAALLFVLGPAAIQARPAVAAPPQMTSIASTSIASTSIASTSSGHITATDTSEAAAEHAPGATPARSTVSARATHIVARGETLWSIAESLLGAGARYPEIIAVNPQLGGHPDFLATGTELTLPATAPAPRRAQHTVAQHTVTVHQGDTLSEIAHRELGDARRYPEIFDASTSITEPGGAHLSDPDLIVTGWTLTIPGSTPASPAEPKPAAPTTTEKSTTPQSAAPTHPGKHATPKPAAPKPAAPKAAAPKPGTASGSQGRGPARASEHAPSADDQDSAGGSHVLAGRSTADTDEQTVAPWMLAGLTGGGAVLAGSMLLVLRRRRSTQFRSRRPGRAIAATQPALAPVEKTVMSAGSSSAPTVEFMDEVLRRLASHAATGQHPMPEVAAVQLTDTALVLHLSEPADLPGPWAGSTDRMHWTLPQTADVDDIASLLADQAAPYPMLVTIGASDNGEIWLLNLENLDLVITGDPTYGADFARYIAAEIACNPWSSAVRVQCVGVAEEIAPMNPDRIRVHQDHGADPAADVLTDAVRDLDRTQDLGTTVATARAIQVGDDAWGARMLLIDASANQTPALTQLLDLISEHPGHTGTAVVINGHRQGTPGVTVQVGSNGRLTMAKAGLDLIAVGLTSDEAQGCAALLAQAANLADEPTTIDQKAKQGWRSMTDRAGALRTEHTLPRATHADQLDEPASSVLAAPDDDYVAAAATTPEDLQALAPIVTSSVRAQVEVNDPTLDGDVAAWFSKDCPLPRLTLLGPVNARTRGVPATSRKPYWTEILAFLALRPYGATPDELADAFNITTAKAREYARVVREWLGTNPRTGHQHLPDARHGPSAKTRGVGVYEVIDVLVDVDLFRRLRARGQARGADGIGDLRTALRLVNGRPFDHLRRSGWSWLFEGDRLDQHMVCAIVDVAHIVTSHDLQAGDFRQAQIAAETAIQAAPDDEIARLDLASIAKAQGHNHEAEEIVRDQVCNRTDDDGPPPELPKRTERILAGHDWLTPGKVAS